MDTNIWTQNQYRIRKKVVALVGQYWIENGQGTILGYSRQKFLKIKEDIKVFTDDTMAQELFRISQENLVDSWGTFAVIDSPTNQTIRQDPAQLRVQLRLGRVPASGCERTAIWQGG